MIQIQSFSLNGNGRRNKSDITRIRHNGHWVKGVQEIGKIFSYYFQFQFGTSMTQRFLMDWQNLFIHKARVDLSSLELPFTTEEIKQSVFDLNADKAPG